MILIMGSPKKVPTIQGTPHIPPEEARGADRLEATRQPAMLEASDSRGFRVLGFRNCRGLGFRHFRDLGFRNFRVVDLGDYGVGFRGEVGVLG